ncbi:TonB-dependent receptor [Fibrisoma montanum]|uniref:TonB-dependent receptor n=1 Tax=Fibrisoma montanum TaxID=2305895 RepID=A0A418MIB0_9BACT|nr:TonB-dependent receptor [Fibrisoma montanum]RIV27175.1 TonB-dependent receptor [Fibrisoma montanum]
MNQLLTKMQRAWLTAVCWLAAATLLFAQSGSVVTGKVTDDAGQALPGVTVVEKGTNSGTTTDNNGAFSLRVRSGKSTLVFSFVGYLSRELAVDNQSSLTVSLSPDTKQLGEVVVVGYGTQEKKDLTGAIASVGSKDIQKLPVSGVDQALQGQVAGLQISQSNGAPGANTNILIRGIGSISGGNEPLFVIDGYPVTNSGIGNPLNTINPNDIESIDVLKDASSTAIYGSRGSNGVIMITTKRGKAGKTRIEVDAYTGFQQVARKLDLLNTPDFVQFIKDGRNNGYIDNNPNGKITDPNNLRPNSFQIPALIQGDISQLPNTDWQDAIFRTAPIQNYQISASGGNENIRYSISGGYFSQKGIIISSGLERYSFRMNLDGKISNRINVGVTMLPSFTKQDDVSAIGHSGGAVVQAALSLPPYFPVYNPDGSYFVTYRPTEGDISYPNPVQLANELKIDGTQLRFFGNAYAEVSILEGLKFRTTIGTDLNYAKNRRFQPNTIDPISILTNATGTNTEATNWLNENTFSYKKRFGDHSVDAVAGFTAQKAYSNVIQAQATRFPDNLIESVNGGTINAGYENVTIQTLLSYLARVNYSFKDKYLVTATVRRDGSSRFGADNRWGTFPSASVGWRVSEEEFMKGVTFVSDLKFRASYGLTGNNAIGDYRAIGLLQDANYIIGNTLTPGLGRSTFTNSLLGWESMKQLDLGVDFSMLNNRVSVTADYYDKRNTDMLFTIQTPAATGLTSAVVNLGEVQNRGFEFAVSSRNTVKAFKWTTSANITFNQNKVLSMSADAERIFSTALGRTAYAVTQAGDPIGSFFGRRVIGVFQTDEEATTYGKQPFAKAGDFKWEDINNDGRIDDNDRTVIGSPHPKFFFGFNNNFSYKGFTLDVLTNGMVGQKIYNATFSVNNSGVQNQIQEVFDNRWVSPSQPGNGMYGRSIRGGRNNNPLFSDAYLFDGSFLRIRNVTLAYNIPSSLINRLGVGSARVYATGTNLFTFTSYNGYDPEVSASNDDLRAAGLDFGTYPQARTITFGINLGF